MATGILKQLADNHDGVRNLLNVDGTASAQIIRAAQAGIVHRVVGFVPTVTASSTGSYDSHNGSTATKVGASMDMTKDVSCPVLFETAAGEALRYTGNSVHSFTALVESIATVGGF